MKKYEQMPYDKRLRDLNLSRGNVTEEAIKKHLKELPDEADNVEEIEVYDELDAASNAFFQVKSETN